MGVCESLFSEESQPNDKEKKYKRNNDQINQRISQYPPIVKPNKGNLFCTPIGDSTNENNFKNMSMSQSQSQLTLINYPKKKVELPVYKNVYKQNGNLQTSLATGSLFGDTNNISSIMSGNKGESKYSENMSTSKSFGEFIIENQINKKMEGDQDFNNFMKMNKDNIINDTSLTFNDNDNNKNNNNNNDSQYKNNNKNNNNKKDVNYYHKKNSKNNNHPPIPMDTEV